MGGTFRMTCSLDNDAFVNRPGTAIAELLLRYAKAIQDTVHAPTDEEGEDIEIKVFDINGNSIGDIEIHLWPDDVTDDDERSNGPRRT